MGKSNGVERIEERVFEEAREGGTGGVRGEAGLGLVVIVGGQVPVP
jgi:hypothetical protein